MDVGRATLEARVRLTIVIKTNKEVNKEEQEEYEASSK